MPLVENVEFNFEEVTTLLAPINESSPVGDFDEENALYLFIEEEMIKFGGLQSASIDWAGVEKKAVQILTKEFKHMRVFAYLMQCWTREKTWIKNQQASELLLGFCKIYFKTSYPRPGESGLLAKRRFLTSMVDGLKAGFDALDVVGQDKALFESYHKTLKELKSALEEVAANDSTLHTLTIMHDKVLSYSQRPESTEPAPAPVSNQQATRPLGGSFASTPSFATGSIGDERETKRTLLSVAELINQKDPHDSTGYLLRRYALWGWITTSPIVANGKRTELRSAPKEVVSIYEDALNSNMISTDLLSKIESSVVSSTYWFKGSYYAYEVAKKLEMQEVAQAIWQATTRFIHRLPVLLELQFNDSQPFIDEVTAEWIKKMGGSQDVSSQHVATVDDQYLKEEMSALMEKKGVEAMLLYVEKKQAQKYSMRKHAQVLKIAADLLSEKGLSWLAEEFYKKVESQMSATLAAHWEPDFYQQVCMQATSSEG